MAGLVPFKEITRAVREYHAALAEGMPAGYTVSNQRSAVSATSFERNALRLRLNIAVELGVEVMEWPAPDAERAERRRAAYEDEPGYKSWQRRRAARGLVAAPPIPGIARPPEGFIVSRNSASYDADGKLLRQHIRTARDSGEPFEIPAGHVVKGESALVDPDGRVLAKWIKTREGAGEGFVDALRAAFADYEGKARPIPAPPQADDDLLTFYPIPDLHLGMYAWEPETGDNYDVATAVSVATTGIAALAAQARPSRKAVVCFLGDYFHANDAKAVTPNSGHLLDVDGRWAKVFLAGAKLAIELIEVVAAKHDEVEVVVIRGNHDPDAAMSLAVALALFYSSNPRITINQSPAIAWFRRFGACLLAATHGHTMKPERMAWMMAVDRPDDWGATRHRSMFFGHIHHETKKEVGGVNVESFGSPAGKDAWNAASGYRSGRALHAVTFHREDGEIGRIRVNVVKPKSAVPGSAP